MRKKYILSGLKKNKITCVTLLYAVFLICMNSFEIGLV